MIKLVANSARTKFYGPEKQLKKMFPALRIEDKNAKWREFAEMKRNDFFRGYKKKDRDEEIAKIKKRVKWAKFYDRRGDTFQTGLLPRVIRRLEKKGIKYELVDKRKKMPEFDLNIKKLRFIDKVETRQEQLDMVKAAMKHGRGILHCATNAGKTEVACGIIAEWEHQTGQTPRVLFLIHRAGLVEQTAERFRKHLDCKVTMVGGGEKDVPATGIIVATIQTANNLLNTFDFMRFQDRCDILFIDEFHLNKAWVCSHIVQDNNASMRIGLSGTINEKNRAKMMHYVGLTGPIISEVRNKLLVELGRSAKPSAVFKEVRSEKIPAKKGWQAAYRMGIVKNGIRNRMVVRDTIKHLDKERKVLVTVARIAHGNILKRRFEKKIDLRVEFLSGSTSSVVRRKVIRQFEKGKVAVLIASPIFDTGVDIPAITGWVNAAGGRGWELVLQRLGRVLRRKQEGENKVYISDYVDLQSKYLFRHSLARINHYLKEEIVDIKIIGKGHNDK